MTDDGRLELDDSGAVIDPAGAPSSSDEIVDLQAPDSADLQEPATLQLWARTQAAPWVSAHRRTVAMVTAVAVSVLVAGGWWSSRPEPLRPIPRPSLTNAPVVGADLGGPRLGPDGHLSVAYNVAADPELAGVTVLGLVGPGLAPLGVEGGSAALGANAPTFVQVGAQVSCDDVGIPDATASSYAIIMRRTGSGGQTVERSVPFDDTTTSLDIAVRQHCVGSIAPLLYVTQAELSRVPGSASIDLVMHVHNASALPVTLAIWSASASTPGARSTTPSTEVAGPNDEVTLAARLLRRDCSAAHGLSPRDSLPNPVSPRRLSRQVSPAGITLRLKIGTSSAVASYGLPTGAARAEGNIGWNFCG